MRKPSADPFCPLWLEGQPRFPIHLKSMSRYLQRALPFVFLIPLDYVLAFGMKIRWRLAAFSVTILEAADIIILREEKLLFGKRY